MPSIDRIFTLTITAEQFLNACSPDELKEIDLLIQSPRFINKMKGQEKVKPMELPWKREAEA